MLIAIVVGLGYVAFGCLCYVVGQDIGAVKGFDAGMKCAFEQHLDTMAKQRLEYRTRVKVAE